MAVVSLIPPTARHDSIHVVSARITQAQGIAQAINVVISDRLDYPGRGGLSDKVLQKLARAADDLLEQAAEAMRRIDHA